MHSKVSAHFNLFGGDEVDKLANVGFVGEQLIMDCFTS
jgi:hypothetical protein